MKRGQVSAVKFNVTWERIAVGTGKPEAGADSCAEIVAGLMLSPALAVPGAAGPMAVETFKACGAGFKVLSQPVGPFPVDACGTYTVRLALHRNTSVGYVTVLGSGMTSSVFHSVCVVCCVQLAVNI
jgi:hypothetical protein